MIITINGIGLQKLKRTPLTSDHPLNINVRRGRLQTGEYDSVTLNAKSCSTFFLVSMVKEFYCKIY